MGRIEELAARDGWVCWLCEGEIDPDAIRGHPAAATVDHVVPKSRGGRTEPANLRLAHRRCNAQRGNDLPELEWPERFMLTDPTSLWQSLARILRRRSPEIIAVAPTVELATEAGDWARARAERFVGGDWAVEVQRLGTGEQAVVRLDLTGEPEISDVGRPVRRR